MEPQTKKAISIRMIQEKKLLIEQIEKTPVIQIACEKTWVGRSTYYRWMTEDKKFAKVVKESMARWVQTMNDMAESQLLKNIKDGNMTAIIFWLKSRHVAYGNRVEITDTREREELTKDQELLIKRVLKKYNIKKISNSNPL